MRPIVISIFLYACKTWTLTAELQKRIQVIEMRCYHVINEDVRRKIQAATGRYDELLTLVKRRKLMWFGHISRSSGLAQMILQNKVKRWGRKGRQKRRWEDKIKEWTGIDFDRDGLC